jgi:hypothetical protein
MDQQDLTTMFPLMTSIKVISMSIFFSALGSCCYPADKLTSYYCWSFADECGLNLLPRYKISSHPQPKPGLHNTTSTQSSSANWDQFFILCSPNFFSLSWCCARARFEQVNTRASRSSRFASCEPTRQVRLARFFRIFHWTIKNTLR